MNCITFTTAFGSDSFLLDLVLGSFMVRFLSGTLLWQDGPGCSHFRLCTYTSFGSQFGQGSFLYVGVSRHCYVQVQPGYIPLLR